MVFPPGLVIGALPAVGPVPLVNTAPTLIFPDDSAILLNLTHAQIGTLMMWYNNTFMIAGADNIGIRRSKLQNFIEGN